jgi:hypothetical protein
MTIPIQIRKLAYRNSSGPEIANARPPLFGYIALQHAHCAWDIRNNRNQEVNSAKLRNFS